MSVVTEGREAGELSSTILMASLGSASARGAALLLALVGRRIPDARPVDSAT